MKRSTRRGRDGDYLKTCDRSGFVDWASNMLKEWNGLSVHRKFYDPRHPQDFIRARREDLRVPDPRPEPIAVYQGPLMTELTESAVAGDTNITVLHTERMQGGDHVGIYLTDGDLHRNIIQEVTDLTDLILINPLPGAAESGAKLVNFTAVAV